MEALAGLVILAAILALLVLPIAALVQANRAVREAEGVRRDLAHLDARVAALAKRVVGQPAPEGATPPVPRPSALPDLPPPAPTRPAPPPPDARPASPRPPRPHVPSPDLATNLGPKILVGVGALAVAVALAFFVKYAWENDWIGPTGRVLFGCAVSLAMMAGGLRLLDREYRPLGQGLAGAGLAGLYSAVYGAHAVYGLVPRGVDFVLLLLVTASALALSVRLDARILAAIAWVGGYLTPVVLSTGEDKALSLFAYLALLGAGAMILDRSRPWAETAPLGMVGTIVLYGGWYAQFFRAERFGVAAVGMTALTALFALGMARKERHGALVSVYLVASIGLALLGAQADRPWELLLLSLALGGGALHAASLWGPGLSVVAAVAMGLPYFVWAATHARGESFAAGAAWVVGATLTYVAAGASKKVPIPIPLEGAVLVVSGVFTIALADSAPAPWVLAALLLAQWGIALLSRRRFGGAELTAVVAAATILHANFERFSGGDQARGFLLVSLVVYAAYLCGLVARSFLAGARVGAAGAAAHLVNAALVWGILCRRLYDTSPSTLGLASVCLAALYLVVGLGMQRLAKDDLHPRVALSLAAGFLTLAIPVQLGLSGITLAWAIEGLVLLHIGVRFRSVLARAGGYGVLALSVARLFARHTPLHVGAFEPVVNASFGTWLAVIGALGAALMLTRAAGPGPDAPDRVMRPVLAVTLLVLLFGLLTTETQAAFGQRAQGAAALGDDAAVRQARLMGGLAVSVLWGSFATGLLATGLGMRNRPLFYTAYALFAATAGKVVLVDLAQLQTLYRIVSFLVLGILLMAGAYLNIRFRGRLAPPPTAEA
jgi:uncharacterized membrane protein